MERLCRGCRGRAPQADRADALRVPVTPAWSSRTGLIAYVRPGCEDCDAAVWVTRPASGGRRKLTTHLGNLTDPAWSPNGRSLAAVRVGGGLYAIPARGGGS